MKKSIVATIMLLLLAVSVMAADEVLKSDPNGVRVGGAVTDNAALEVVNLRVDPTSKRLSVDAVVLNATGWDVKVYTITAAGTGEQLPALTVPDGFQLLLRAQPDNTGSVYIATSKTNAEGTHRGTLKAGDVLKLGVTDANVIWWNASAASQKIEVWREVK